MRQALDLGFRQQLTITPQLLQSIRLMAMPTLELEQSLQESLESNVMLEAVGDDAETAARREVRLTAAPVSRARVVLESNDDQRSPEACVRTQILDQLADEFPGPDELELAFALVDEVEDSGYLQTPLHELAAHWGVDEIRLETLLHRIQKLEPAGFGARSLAECLIRQLEALPAREPGRNLARRLVRAHLDDMARHDDAALADALGVSATALAQAIRLIRSLDPKPGATVSEAEYVIPDIIVEADAQGCWQVRLHDNALPRLQINAAYEAALRQCGASGQGLRDQLQEARLLLRGVEMRQSTLLKTALAIFERQAGFAERGETGIAPMTLREIADAVGMHESSISRVVRGKYAQTPRGIYELRFFFSAQVGGQRREDVSGNAVRAMVRDLVSHESPDAPLCDGDISAILLRRGIKLGRRTITKYRHAMGIPCAEDRRDAARHAS